MNIQDRKFEAWKHGLLDVSRRNKLMNYRKTHRATLQITVPEMSELYRRLNGEGQRLVFRKNRLLEPDAMLERLLYLFDQLGRPIELAEGELRSDLDTDDMQLTLKNLSSKALLAREDSEGTIKFSLRAKEPDSVNDIAQSFGGGGHPQAAGITMHGSLEETVRQVLDAMICKLNG